MEWDHTLFIGHPTRFSNLVYTVESRAKRQRQAGCGVEKQKQPPGGHSIYDGGAPYFNPQ